jgi:RNA polymerase sigma factor (sigma-70 family)
VTSAIQYKKDIKDEEIIRRIKQNDNRVWEILQVKYYKMLEIFVTKNSGSADDAWDNFQETMAALFVNVSKTNFRLTCAFKTYVYQINRNMWLAELKRQKRRPIRVYDNEDNEFADIDTWDVDSEAFWTPSTKNLAPVLSNVNLSVCHEPRVMGSVASLTYPPEPFKYALPP